jgi:hypothetical protein
VGGGDTLPGLPPCRVPHRRGHGGGWIIAMYPRPCEHDVGGTILIDLRDVEMSERTRPAPPGDLARYVAGRRCTGRNKRGRPCGSYAAPGSDYCRAHQAVGKPA